MIRPTSIFKFPTVLVARNSSLDTSARSPLRCLAVALVLLLLILLPAGQAIAQEQANTNEGTPAVTDEPTEEPPYETPEPEAEPTAEEYEAQRIAEAAQRAVAASLSEAGVTAGQFRTNNLWILIAAALVFIMHLGFGCVESGLCRAKNSVNILTKNLWIICTGILAYWAWGFVAHYPGDLAASPLSKTTWLIPNVFAYGKPLSIDAAGTLATYADGGYTAYADFIFQAMFAATGATIVSGAVAERIKLAPFMVFAVVFVAFGYPFVGSWHWGTGWLADLGFHDFAGSSVVHAFGGFGALAGVLLLGPRIGKYGPAGEVRGIPGHNIPLVNIGVFMLFLGWFGFNGGSVLSAAETVVSDGSNGPTVIASGVGFVFVTTTLAGVTGGMIALLTSWGVTGKPDLTMGLNGLLAGLVGITAGADSISPGWSIVVGGIAGALVVFSVYGFDKIKIDDPVGAISVHGVCGVWGTVAVGIFGGKNLGVQILGTLAVSITAFLIAFVIFFICKLLGGIRVSESEELEGLDLGEHGMRAYHGMGDTVSA